MTEPTGWTDAELLADLIKNRPNLLKAFEEAKAAGHPGADLIESMLDGCDAKVRELMRAPPNSAGPDAGSAGA